MQSITLKAENREQVGRSLNSLRNKNWIPAILYGHEIKKGIPLKVESHGFHIAYKQAGKTSLIDLEIVPTFSKEKSGSRPGSVGSETSKVLIHDIQYHPKTDNIIHIDLYKVNMKEKIKTEVPVVTIGVSPAVRDLEGSLLVNLNNIEIECLPGNLIQEIKVDISPLKTFEDKILVSDLSVPETVEILNDKEAVVALVNPPRSEEELEALDEAIEEDVEGVEVTEEKLEEEEDETAESEKGEIKEDKAGKEKPAESESSAKTPTEKSDEKKE